MACGHILYAVRRGMAECTPNLRAAYDAADTTPRSSGRPPTTTGLPLSEGSNSSSTDTKNASMSRWKYVRIGSDSAHCPALGADMQDMDVFVARQPIFDRQRQVYAYELLFRSDPDRNEFDGTEASSATAQVIANSLFSVGLENISGGKKAFINFGR